MFHLPKFTIDWSVLFQKKVGYLAVQLGSVAAVLCGVAHYLGPSAAWIGAGVIAFMAIERQPDS